MFPPWRSDSFQKYKVNLKFTPYRSSAQMIILSAELACCHFASSLSDLVHEIRSFTLLVISSPRELLLRKDSVRSRCLHTIGRGMDENLVRFREYILLRYNKHLKKSTRDKLQRSSTLIGHQQLRF